MRLPSFKALFLFTTSIGCCLGAAAPDCSYHFTYSNVTGFKVDNKVTYISGPTIPLNNIPSGCQSWSFSTISSGYSAVSISLQSAPAGVSPVTPGTFVTFAGSTTSGSNPNSIIGSSTYLGVGVYPWMRVNVLSVTGTGNIDILLFGWKDPNFGGSTGGGPPTGIAGGDLSGTYPNPGVNGLIVNNILFNEFFGTQTGNTSVTGDSNTAFGYQAGHALTIGSTPQAVSAFGYRAAANCTTCRETTAIGYRALEAYTGNGVGVEDGINTVVGSYAGLVEIGSSNAYFGQKAGINMATSTDTNNLFAGTHAGASWTTGIDNIILGRAADGAVGNTGNHNFFANYAAAASLGAKNYDIFIGNGAGGAATTVDNLILIGRNAGVFITTGPRNLAVGDSALAAAVTSSDNVAVGPGAGIATTSNQNTVVGSAALGAATTGNGNTAIGFQAGNHITGAQNTIVGQNSGQSVTSGKQNTFIGSGAGNGGCNTCDSNIVIGFNANTGGSATGAVAIGIGSSNSVSHTMQFETWNFLDNAGNFTAKSYRGTATASFTPQAGAGTGATAVCATSHVCDSYSGEVTLTAGSLGTPTTGSQLIITTGITRTNQPNCAVTIEGGTTFLGDTHSASTTTITISAGIALTSGTAYQVAYVCGGQ